MTSPIVSKYQTSIIKTIPINRQSLKATIQTHPSILQSSGYEHFFFNRSIVQGIRRKTRDKQTSRVSYMFVRRTTWYRLDRVFRCESQKKNIIVMHKKLNCMGDCRRRSTNQHCLDKSFSRFSISQNYPTICLGYCLKIQQLSLQRATADRCNCHQTCASTGGTLVGTAGGREPVGLFFAIDFVVHLLLNGTSQGTRDDTAVSWAELRYRYHAYHHPRSKKQIAIQYVPGIIRIWHITRTRYLVL